jgi:phosphoglycerate dehydrogenase-like enzyme
MKPENIRRVRVLYLPDPNAVTIWAEELLAAVGPRHDLSIYDPKKPLADQFRGIEVVLDHGGSIGTREMYDAAADVRLWQILGTGLDHVDVRYMSTKTFKIANCPGQFSGVALAECAMMFMLMLSRHAWECAENFRRRITQRPAGRQLAGKILGIVGFGSSGQELARRAKAFGMRIHAIDVRAIEPRVIEELRPEFLGTPADLDRVVAECDFLSLHLHLTPETKHTIDARRIGLMKPSACIINVARGALVDQEAMYRALLDGRLGGAGLDVFHPEPPDPTHPVFRLQNVVVTPHVSGLTEGTARNRAAVAAENLDRVAQGLEPLYEVGQR